MTTNLSLSKIVTNLMLMTVFAACAPAGQDYKPTTNKTADLDLTESQRKAEKQRALTEAFGATTYSVKAANESTELQKLIRASYLTVFLASNGGKEIAAQLDLLFGDQLGTVAEFNFRFMIPLSEGVLSSTTEKPSGLRSDIDDTVTAQIKVAIDRKTVLALVQRAVDNKSQVVGIVFERIANGGYGIVYQDGVKDPKSFMQSSAR